MGRNICFSKVRHLEGRLGCPIQIVYELINDKPNQVFNVLGGKYKKKNAYRVIFLIDVRKNQRGNQE